MATKHQVPATDTVRRILTKVALYRGDTLFLGKPGSLPQADYQEVGKFLELLEIKWDRQRKGHVRVGVAKVKTIVMAALKQGHVVDEQKAFAFFPTVPAVADRMAAQLFDGRRAETDLLHVLEPSAGDGALLKAVRRLSPEVWITAMELDPKRRPVLTKLASLVIIGDFLQRLKPIMSDCIIMNPPFTQGQDIAHVLHAFTMLRPNGKLVALMWPGWKTSSTKRARAFRELYDRYDGGISYLAPGEADGGMTKNALHLITLTRKGITYER